MKNTRCTGVDLSDRDEVKSYCNVTSQPEEHDRTIFLIDFVSRRVNRRLSVTCTIASQDQLGRARTRNFTFSTRDDSLILVS